MKKILIIIIGLLLLAPAVIFAASVNIRGKVILLGALRILPSITSQAAFSPTDIPGLKVWVKADAITGLSDGDTVNTWSDSSGNSNDFIRGAGTPMYKTNIVNGLPAVMITSALGGKMTTPNFGAAQPDTIFIVFQRTTDGSAMCLYDGLGQFTQLLYNSSGSGSIAMFADNNLAGTTVATGVWAVFSSIFNGASSVTYSNGQSIITGDVGASNGGGMTIGETGGGSFNTDGVIAEILYYNSSLSTTNRQAVEDYLGTKYAITISH